MDFDKKRQLARDAGFYILLRDTLQKYCQTHNLGRYDVYFSNLLGYTSKSGSMQFSSNIQDIEYRKFSVDELRLLIVNKNDDFISAGIVGASYQTSGYFTYYSKYLSTLIFPMSAIDFLSYVGTAFAIFLSEVNSKVDNDNSLPDANIYISRIIKNNLDELSNLLSGIEFVDLYV